MNISDIPKLLKQQFRSVIISDITMDLTVGSLPEWDSLGHFNLLLLIEQSYDINFSMEEMSEMKSLNDIAKVLKAKGVKD
jgi:acyl carrier protein